MNKMEDKWHKKFPNGVAIEKIKLNKSWKAIFDMIKKEDKKGWDEINKSLSEEMKKGKIYPIPEEIFNAFNMIDFDKVRVVFIGQDPYPGEQEIDNIKHPEATGIAFSVRKGLKIPRSLKNIIKNLEKYKHIKKPITHGNLESWVKQGCLMLNKALTIKKGVRNSHKKIWELFTDKIIKELAKRKDIIFVCWGKEACEKVASLTNRKIISSHPSSLSCYKKMGEYEAFMNVDHFGKINKELSEKIIWELK